MVVLRLNNRTFKFKSTKPPNALIRHGNLRWIYFKIRLKSKSINIHMNLIIRWMLGCCDPFSSLEMTMFSLYYFFLFFFVCCMIRIYTNTVTVQVMSVLWFHVELETTRIISSHRYSAFEQERKHSSTILVPFNVNVPCLYECSMIHFKHERLNIAISGKNV